MLLDGIRACHSVTVEGAETQAQARITEAKLHAGLEGEDAAFGHNATVAKSKTSPGEATRDGAVCPHEDWGEMVSVL